MPEQVVRALARDGVADVFDLEPLGRREVAELLGALLDAEPPPELVDDVVARTDGVPLLVEEVLDAHLRSGSVDVGEQRRTLARREHDRVAHRARHGRGPTRPAREQPA